MNIPAEVNLIVRKLIRAGHEAYLVGGCARDLIMKTAPKDWDVATSAKPETVAKLFNGARYDNQFGTVAVPIHKKATRKAASLASGLSATPYARGEVEVTTYRVEESYTDKRHPDKVRFTRRLEKDLARRDFTINALALLPRAGAGSPKALKKNQIFLKSVGLIDDPYGGIRDLRQKIIRAVGDPQQRFNEDALRMLRAVRFAVQLGFRIKQTTFDGIRKNAPAIKRISAERVRDELIKIIESDQPYRGLELMRRSGLLKIILPELLEGYGVAQAKHHIYDVYRHNLLSLKFAAELGYDLTVRLAALFHDIGKPRSKKGVGERATFHQHEVIGAKMTRALMSRLRFPNRLTDTVTHLVRHHLFYYDIGVVTERGVRRLLRRVGRPHIQALIQVRMAERLGSGVPKARPYRLRHLEYMLDKVADDPITTSMLAVDGNDVMRLLGIKPGPRVGLLLNALLEQVLDDPGLNTRESLIENLRKLQRLSDQKLRQIGQGVTGHKEARETERKRKFWVK